MYLVPIYEKIDGGVGVFGGMLGVRVSKILLISPGELPGNGVALPDSHMANASSAWVLNR